MSRLNPDLIDRAEEHESAGANWADQAMRDRCPRKKRRKYLAESAAHFTIAAGLRAMAVRAE